jgi:peptide/nickel transport system substrate-binding protein
MHAIDRDSMVKQIVGQGARVVHTVCFPPQFGCSDEGAPRYSYDPAKANQLLAEAGFKDGFDIDLYAYRERNQTEAMIGYLRRRHQGEPAFHAIRGDARANRAGRAAMLHQTGVRSRSTTCRVDAGLLSWRTMFARSEVRDFKRGGLSRSGGARRPTQGACPDRGTGYSVPLYSLTTFYVYTKDLAFTPYPDELPRFWETRWK